MSVWEILLYAVGLPLAWLIVALAVALIFGPGVKMLRGDEREDARPTSEERWNEEAR